MKLYHFCAPQFLRSIQERGLILGVTPFRVDENKTSFLRYTQWMTVNPSFEQSWNGMVTVKYDRTAFRLTYAIPKGERSHVLTWQELKARMQRSLGENCIPIGFDNHDYCDPDNWRIFMGRVKPGWLRGVTAKADAVKTVDLTQKAG